MKFLSVGSKPGQIFSLAGLPWLILLELFSVWHSGQINRGFKNLGKEMRNLITGNKFEVWHSITKDNRSLYETKDKKLTDDSIIRIAKEEYDCNLIKKDLEQMRDNFEYLLRKYKMLL